MSDIPKNHPLWNLKNGEHFEPSAFVYILFDRFANSEKHVNNARLLFCHQPGDKTQNLYTFKVLRVEAGGLCNVALEHHPAVGHVGHITPRTWG